MIFPVRRMACRACDKWAYFSRKDAKKVMRSLYPGDKALNAYRCPTGSGGWHIGHSYRKARQPAA